MGSGMNIIFGAVDEIRDELSDLQEQKDVIDSEIQELTDSLAKLLKILPKNEVAVTKAEKTPASSLKENKIVKNLSTRYLMLYILVSKKCNAKEIGIEMEALGWKSKAKDPMISTIQPTLSRLKKNGYIEQDESKKFIITKSGKGLIKFELERTGQEVPNVLQDMF